MYRGEFALEEDVPLDSLLHVFNPYPILGHLRDLLDDPRMSLDSLNTLLSFISGLIRSKREDSCTKLFKPYPSTQKIFPVQLFDFFSSGVSVLFLAVKCSSGFIKFNFWLICLLI